MLPLKLTGACERWLVGWDQLTGGWKLEYGVKYCSWRLVICTLSDTPPLRPLAAGRDSSGILQMLIMK